MISTDENALICDLAETYHIFDYRELPPSKVAVLAIGLRKNSRIKMSMSKMRIDENQVFLAAILDCLKQLVWLNSSNASKGTNRPDSILKKLLGNDASDNKAFSSVEEFERARKEIIDKVKERN